MASYGVAIIIITAAVAAVYVIGMSSKTLFSQECTGSSGFGCGPFFLNYSGVLNITLQQAIGGDITIYGLACSSAISSTSVNSLPDYGNKYVTNSIIFYPTGASPGTGERIYTGGSLQFDVNCYDSSGIATKANESGNDFIGYIWANYSISGQSAKITQTIATIEAKYV